MSSAPDFISLAQHLTQSAAPAAEDWADLMRGFCAPAIEDSAKSEALSILAARRIDGEMLAACAAFLLAEATPLPLHDTQAIDVCGTGGDKSREGVKTFNISTASAFVAAAAGQSVIKHGNRAVSSQAGSSDVLAALGVAIAENAENATADLDAFGLCFVAAPAFHPVLKHAAAARRAHGQPTFFNLLGPLCNPARVTRQIMGVFSAHYLTPVAEAAAALGKTDMLVLHSEDGLDEISLAAPTAARLLRGGRIESLTITPADAGIQIQSLRDAAGGSAAENAQIIETLFKAPQGAAADIVALNAGAALWLAGRAADIAGGYALALQTLQNGGAQDMLARMRRKA
ncbi:MAG TPA: anthranilate phosphoribosyltransferase [Alphaproteobacteria bacterium]|nr:anthranilate phosphoribosyltransferase [Alphaproteobacteria bacterium]